MSDNQSPRFEVWSAVNRKAHNLESVHASFSEARRSVDNLHQDFGPESFLIADNFLPDGEKFSTMKAKADANRVWASWNIG